MSHTEWQADHFRRSYTSQSLIVLSLVASLIFQGQLLYLRKTRLLNKVY
jgi:hypothetical protein